MADYKAGGENKTISAALDTQYNAWFGIFIAVWACVFSESWKHKESILIKEWDLKQQKNEIENQIKD